MQKMKNIKRESGHVHFVLLGLVVLIAVAGTGVLVWKADHKHNPGSLANNSSSAANSGTLPNAASTVASYSDPNLPSSGNSNQDLNADLQSINGSINQDSQHLQSTNTAFNDQALPIAN